MEYNNPKPPFDPETPWKSIRENTNLEIAFFGFVWFICVIIGTLLSQSLASFAGIHDFSALIEGFKEGYFLEHINTLKIVSICSHLCQYLLPVLLFTYFLYRKRSLNSLYADRLPRASNIILSITLIITIFPFISFVYYWNTILLPKSAISEDTLFIQNLFLDMKTTTDLFLNLLLLGLVAGIGEEFLFRGVLQRIVTKMSGNIHKGAILTGFAFSAMHFQLEGLLPRFILGVLFCYLLIYTGNLWITVIVHIIFNSSQVLMPYFYPSLVGNVNQVQEISPFIALGSLLVFVGIFFIFIKNNSENNYIKIE